ncbi:MAG: hypothetical protein J0L72_07145 [Armatimonadetes bacterium]|nr:hypothetical protein [Armatimonadota bacterium]
MKKLLLGAITLAILAGCGGDGSDTTTTTSGATTGATSGGTGREYPTFNLGTGALLQTSFVSGQGRSTGSSRATGSQVALIKSVQFRNDANDFVPSSDQILGDEIRVQLDGYTLNTKAFGVTFGIGQTSKRFLEYPMEIAQFLRVESDNSLTPLTPEDSIAFQPPVPFDCDVRVFAGRVSSVNIRLDDSMVSFDDVAGAVTFNPDLFVASNYDLIHNRITSSFSDYLAFDISQMPTGDRPPLSISGDPADRVFFSGDGYGISNGLGAASQFELLSPVRIDSGRLNTGSPLGSGGGSGIGFGANWFILEDQDPLATRLTSLIGIWKPFTQAVNSSEDVTVIALPSSRENDGIEANEEQQILFYKRNVAGKIIDLWYGQVYYNTDGDQTAGTFRAYPISTVTDAVPTQQVDGTISGVVITSGAARRGDWQLSSPPSNWPFGTEGGFGVYRR